MHRARLRPERRSSTQVGHQLDERAIEDQRREVLLGETRQPALHEAPQIGIVEQRQRHLGELSRVVGNQVARQLTEVQALGADRGR